jgi:DNA-binding transcriptional LysR family regulator
MFDFRKLEVFCKVCELRSFSKAGEALFLSQPTVSAHVQSLEREMGVRLLDRMGRTVVPTPAGETLCRYASQAFLSLEAAKAEIDSLAGNVSGDLLFGSSSIPAHHMLPGVITPFLGKHPHVRFSLRVSSSQAVLQQLVEGELMAGIVGRSTHSNPDLVFSPLAEDEILVIASAACDIPAHFPRHSSESSLPEIAFEDAHFISWILREPTSTTRCAFEDALREVGHDPRMLRPRLIVNSSHTAVQYVEAGLGLGVATRMTVKEQLRQGRLRAFRISGVYAARHFCSVVHTRRVPFPAAAAFLEFLHSRQAGEPHCALRSYPV